MNEFLHSHFLEFFMPLCHSALKSVSAYLLTLIIGLSLAGCSKTPAPTPPELTSMTEKGERFLECIQKHDYNAAIGLMGSKKQVNDSNRGMLLKGIEMVVEMTEIKVGKKQRWKWKYEGHNVMPSEKGTYTNSFFQLNGEKGKGYMILQFKHVNDRWDFHYVLFKEKL